MPIQGGQQGVTLPAAKKSRSIAVMVGLEGAFLGVWQRFETKWAIAFASPSYRGCSEGGCQARAQFQRVVQDRAVSVEI
jgi:hypothetical protein